MKDRERPLDLGIGCHHRRHEAKHVHATVAATHLEDEAVVKAVARDRVGFPVGWRLAHAVGATALRSEEHTSELQSQSNLVCRLLLEKKNKPKAHHTFSPSLR